MQEEMERKAVAISVKAGKLTADLLKKAITKALAEMEKSQKNPKIYRCKQSVKHLVRQGAGVSNIEVTDGNIKSFERVARKYGVDFALKKDTTSQPPRYLVFFKSKDADALTAAFAEYSGKVVKRQAQAKPSIRRQLVQLQEVVKKMAQSLSSNKQQDKTPQNQCGQSRESQFALCGYGGACDQAGGSLPADLWRGCAGQGSRVYSRFSLARRSEVPKE